MTHTSASGPAKCDRAWRAALPVRPKPYATLRVGGPLDGTLTLTSTDSAGVTVEAIWGRGRRHRTSLTRPSERAALLLANTWAEELIDGRKPTDSLDRRI